MRRMRDGYVRVAAATPEVQVADIDYNTSKIISMIKNLPDGTALVVFPELCITSCSCGDLFWQPTFIKKAETALSRIINETADINS